MSGALLESLLAASLLAAILPVSDVRSRPHLLLTMVVVWLARPLTGWLDRPALAVMTLGIWTLIGLFAAAAALRFAMRAGQVDAERLYSALSAYLLAGIYFGLLYWVLKQLNPDTFTVTGPFSQTSAIYFSFVTLATRRYRSARRHGAGPCHRRRCWWSAFPGSSGRPPRQLVFEGRGSIKLIILS